MRKLIFTMLLFLAACQAREMRDMHQLEGEALREHCKIMPGMAGCEQFATAEPFFDRSVDGLQSKKPTEILTPKDGETIKLSADMIGHAIHPKQFNFRMFGYNGQIPGPRIMVRQNQTLNIDFTNNLDMNTTVHWHGIRLENKFDGVPDVTQDAVQPGETFRYSLKFLDPGMYWYHPHVREDYQQELGLYGLIVVEPQDDNYYTPADQNEYLVLDDIKMSEQDDVAPYGETVNHALMGRFGNVMLVNGGTEDQISAKTGETVRLFILNAANARPFRLVLPGAEMKLIGSDGGLSVKEELVDAVILAPSERAIVDVFFTDEGEYELRHEAEGSMYRLVRFTVTGNPTQRAVALGENTLVQQEIQKYESAFDKPVDAELVLTAKTDHSMEMPEHEGGIEWEDSMPQMNTMMTDQNTLWIMRDKKTDKENMDIEYRWNVGDLVKIRLFNDPKGMHPMQHPIHFHGQRFLVLAQDGKKNENLVWKDTVLVPAGSTVDILLEVSNPGEWVAHCHIAEHMHAGMMTKFSVEE